ncbi:MAG: TonB-dependent receptor [Burkholderiales bacterium]
MTSIRRCAAALAVPAAACFPHYSLAQAVHNHGLPPAVVITGNPLGSGLFELVAPTHLLEGSDLQLRGAGTLGETLRDTPGMSSSYFGPGSSRPVIRGLDGDRVRILQGSVGTLDASSLSFDHAVPIDPIAITRVEVVRGAAALLYGGSAVGGVVNVLTNRIPESRMEGVSGALEVRGGGAENERTGAASVELGNGRFALHADGFRRSTSDLRIPGFARSGAQRAQDQIDNPAMDQPNGRVPNSAARANGGSIGASLTGTDGHLGFSLANHETTYGSPIETGVMINMHSNRLDIAGEARHLSGFFTSIKFKSGFTDYKHREIDAGVVGTTFANRGFEARIEAAHAALGPLKGVIGMQLGNARFSALGDEAFVPQTRTRSQSVFVFEELPFGNFKLNFGARVEATRINSNGDPAVQDFTDPLVPVARFAASAKRSFRGVSGALGALYSPTPEWSLTANLTHTERAPTFYELFANGPHAATGAYEVGGPGFGLEKSNSLDAGARWRRGPHSAGLSAFVTRFDNYLVPTGTGSRRSGDGAFEDPTTPGTSTTGSTDLLNETRYRAVAARFSGLEAQAHIHLMERPGALFVEFKGDLVRATNLNNGEALPRIPPRRLSVLLGYAFDRTSLRLELSHAAAQSRVPAAERRSAGYTLLNFYASTRLNLGGRQVQGWLRATNLTDREARLATSFLRDIVPLGGRALQAGLRLEF